MTFPIVPGYELTELIGRGGMGRVFRAVDRVLGRTVAVKMLIDADDPELLARFESEARAVACLSHPNIAQLFAFGTTDTGQPYCVMEYAAGGTLADAIGDRPLPWAQAADIVRTLATAMQAAHDQGILHRDLKPGNVLIAHSPLEGKSSSGRHSTTDAARIETTRKTPASGSVSPVIEPICTDSLRIADFGLARRMETDSRVTRTGQVIGTPAYMAPEQASGMTTRPGPGVDIYSLGAMLFEMLTGRPPFLGADSVETIMLLLTVDPPAPRSLQPTIPLDLQTICLKCLEKKPSRRYATAAALADDLTRLLDGRPILARPASTWELLRKWTARNPWIAAALGVFVVSSLAAMIGLAALQAAYSDVKQANSDLSVANQKLVKANADIRDARDLTRESLDRIVNRMRDELHELPQATTLMRETSRDSVELYRRLHQTQPDDSALAMAFVRSLSSHEHLEWLYGSRDQSSAASDEMRRILDEQSRRHPDDLPWQMLRLNVWLDEALYPAKEQTAEQQAALRSQIHTELVRLTEQHAAEPEVWKSASRADQLAMNDAAAAGSLADYLAVARLRVDHSKQYVATERDTVLRLEASLWLSQAQRALAMALRLSKEEAAAEAVLAEALQNCEAATGTDPHRGLRFEKAEVLTELGAITASRGNVPLAMSRLAEALDLLVRLVQEFPEDTAYRVQFATTLLRSAELSEVQGNVAIAREQLATAADQVAQIVKLAPDNEAALALQSAIEAAQARLIPAE